MYLLRFPIHANTLHSSRIYCRMPKTHKRKALLSDLIYCLFGWPSLRYYIEWANLQEARALGVLVASFKWLAKPLLMFATLCSVIGAQQRENGHTPPTLYVQFENRLHTHAAYCFVSVTKQICAHALVLPPHTPADALEAHVSSENTRLYLTCLLDHVGKYRTSMHAPTHSPLPRRALQTLPAYSMCGEHDDEDGRTRHRRHE